MYSVPRIDWMFARLFDRIVFVIVDGMLIRYRSPTTIVHPFVKYNVRLSKSVIGNASHSVPHVLHTDVQNVDTTYSGQLSNGH